MLSHEPIIIMDINAEKLKILEGLVRSKNPEIILRGKVDGAMEDYVFWAFAYLRSAGSPEVKILVDSGGGDADCGQAIYDTIRLYEGKTQILALTDAHSAASLIVQACTLRTMTRHAKMCIHNPSRQSVSLDTIVSTRRRTKLISSLRAYQAAMVLAYAHRTGKKESVIRKKMAEDVMMTAQEAFNFGLIDEIV